ncbi:MAG: right-handed parallel beta-helix repeat-containing protein, partial [Pseudomonadota bacterium]
TGGSYNGMELFANAGAAINHTSNQAIDATGNWWGAPDGPGGNGPGSGDAIIGTGTIDVSSPLIDGSEYSFIDAGGSDFANFGINLPFISGAPSTEWGTSFANSVQADFSGELQLEYNGLDNNAPYKLLLTYINQDIGSSTQTLSTDVGDLIHGPILLPSTASVYAFPIAQDLIDGGILNLRLNAVSGLRAAVSSALLIREPSDDLALPTVSIAEPMNGALLATGNQAIQGTASDTGSGLALVEVAIDLDGQAGPWQPASELALNGSWSYNWASPSSGVYTLRARATDNRGNTSEAVPVEVTVNSDAPQPVNDLLVQSNVTQLSLTWTRSADDGSGDDDVVRYEIYRLADLNAPAVFVGQVGAGSSAFNDPAVTLGVPYFYFVRTVDEAANSADSQLFGPVVLSSTPDTTAPEDVTGLAVQLTNLNGSAISALLNWDASANSEGDLVEHRVYVSADGGTTFGTNAPQFDNAGFFSIDRNTRVFQVAGLTAGVEYDFTVRVVDEVPNESAGATVSATPTGLASEYITLSSNFFSATENATLLQGVYRLINTVTIPAGNSLILDAGVVLKLNSFISLRIDGELEVKGTAGNPVIMTSYRDDSIGGDTNQDGSTMGAPGDWYYLYYAQNSSGSVEHLEIRYGGGSQAAFLAYRFANVSINNLLVEESLTSGVYLRDSVVTMENSVVRNSGTHGIFVDRQNGGGGPFVFRDNQLLDNGGDGLRTRNYGATLERNTLSGNGAYGVNFSTVPTESTQIVLSENTITNNANSVSVPVWAFPDDSNTLIPNTNAFVNFVGGTLSSDLTLKRLSPDSIDELATYRFCGQTTVALGATLTFESGVVAKFCSGIGITVDGQMNALGEPGLPVYFTAETDARFGHNFGFDEQALPSRGYWLGLQFNDSVFETSSSIVNSELYFGGGNGIGMLYLANAGITIENSEVTNSSSAGVYITNASAIMSGNRVWGNAGDGVYVNGNSSAPEITFNQFSSNGQDGIQVNSAASVLATNNQFFANRLFGLRTNGQPVDASQSWWGDSDASGPQQSAGNPAGTGQTVSDSVTITPFQTTPPLQIAYANFQLPSIETAGNLPASTLVEGTLSNEWGTAADRSMAWDTDAVEVDVTGLDPAQPYVLRVSHFNGDAAQLLQSLQDDTGGTIHGPLIMPQSTPQQSEYTLPASLYASGAIRLRFVLENPASALRSAIPELWVLEAVDDLTPPKFVGVEYNDVNGSGVIDEGDEYYFQFSESMDIALLQTGTTDANTRLALAGGETYGTQTHCSADRPLHIVVLRHRSYGVHILS